MGEPARRRGNATHISQLTLLVRPDSACTRTPTPRRTISGAVRRLPRRNLPRSALPRRREGHEN